MPEMGDVLPSASSVFWLGLLALWLLFALCLLLLLLLLAYRPPTFAWLCRNGLAALRWVGLGVLPFFRFAISASWRSACLAAAVLKACGVTWPFSRTFDEVCFFAGRMVLRYARAWLAIFWTPYHYVFMSGLRSPQHWDGHRSQAGITLTRHVRYSAAHRDETLDVIRPAAQPGPTPPPSAPTPIVYVHGGAFVAASSELMLHGTCFLGRAGFTVFSLDYPLSPEHRHPVALVSVLRGLAFIRAAYGVERCLLFGDSAGGNLVSMAAAMLSNRGLLEELARRTGEPLLEFKYPAVERVALLYGFLDSEAPLEGASWVVSLGFRFVLDCYAPRGVDSDMPYTFLALRDGIATFPPTLLLAGEADPIFPSTYA